MLEKRLLLGVERHFSPFKSNSSEQAFLCEYALLDTAQKKAYGRVGTEARR